MAALDIQKHFKALRAETGRRKSRDPFATGFEDESEEEKGSRRTTRTRASPPNTKPAQPAAKPARSSTSDDDLLDPKSQYSATARRLSPAPAHSADLQVGDGAAPRSPVRHQRRSSLGAKTQAGGILAYLDDSDEEGSLAPPAHRKDRRPSPAPRASEDSPQRTRRSSTPQGEKENSPTRPSISRHTVASPFAGTKYLPDSESDTDEEAVTSRQGSADNTNDPNWDIDDGLGPLYSTNRREQDLNQAEKKSKKKQNGSGISWRAFSASRNEQRNAELEALQANLRRRGKRISFGTHARTDDGEQIPVAPSAIQPTGPGNAPRPGGAKGRGRSPPRRGQDVEPTADEVEDGAARVERDDPATVKTSPVPGRLKRWRSNISEYFYSRHLTSRSQDNSPSADEPTATQAHQRPSTPSRPAIPIPASQTSESMTSPSDLPSDETTSSASPALSTTESNLTASIESLNNKLAFSPNKIPEADGIDYSIGAAMQTASPILSPTVGSPSSLSRNSSLRSARTTRASRIPGMGSGSRRASRRSGSQHPTSISPAQAFLSTYNRETSSDVPPPEPNPDDEGQSIGLENEYIIGRTVSSGGFGVVKEVHTLAPRTGARVIRAVKIVRKHLPDADETDNDKAQQELEHEVSVWRYLHHRHILSLHAVYETDFATFCVMDLNIGGTLYDIVRARRTAAAATPDAHKGLEPRLAKRYAYQLARALRYLHEDIRVCHRDIKLENCLIDLSAPDSSTEGGNLRLCDFGLADFLNSGSVDDAAAESLDPDPLPATPTANHPDPFPSRRSAGHLRTTSSVIGTLEYASPKGLSVSRKLFETAGDVWAFGVVVYALCTGELPFRHPMPSKTVEQILHSDWDERALRTAAQSGGEEVMELVRGCLDLDVDLRWTVGDALRSPWFEGCVDEGKEEERRAMW